jgi:hypothetical protein
MVDGYQSGTAQDSANNPNALTENVVPIFQCAGFRHLINYIIWAHLKALF